MAPPMYIRQILFTEATMTDEGRKMLAEQAYEKALKYELDYGCCPQCVLATVQETLGIVDDQTVKASHGLSGGGGLLGEGVCGALSGGLLALSAKYGRDRDKLDKGRYINNFRKAKELTERFRDEFGGVTCRELQQRFTGRTYDMWNADEYKAFDEARGNRCAHATGTVTKWVVEML
jgi:C_GCAxxG_C_C family probable redox protein